MYIRANRHSYDRQFRLSSGSNSRLTNQMPKCFPEITKTSSRENSIDRCFMIMLSRIPYGSIVFLSILFILIHDSRMKREYIGRENTQNTKNIMSSWRIVWKKIFFFLQ